MMQSPLTQPSAPVSNRRDVLPVWGWIVLVLWLLFLYADSRTPLPPGVASRIAKTAENRVDSDALQDLIQVDISTKTAFAMSLVNLGGSAEPDRKTLLEGLSKAEEMEKETHNSISAVRRVLVLRALLGMPPLAASKKGGDPLGAFGKDLPAALAPADRASIVGEGRVWVAALGPGTKPRDREALIGQVRALPNIRWWGTAATAAIYKSAHNPGEAARWNLIARSRALKPLIFAGAIGALRGGLGLLGIPLLIVLIVHAFQLRSNPNASSIWRIEPPAVSAEARRIGAGELAGVFLTYLLTREVISVSASGFIGFGSGHWLHFHGFASRLQALVGGMSDQQRVSAQIIAEAVVYVVSALPPIVVLLGLARLRGASLADEIGLTFRKKGENFLYGWGGYAIALPLMTAIALTVPHLLKLLGAHAVKFTANPANPVIPQIVTASGWFVPVMLVLLAAVAAPILEEILFRGVLMNAIQMRLGVWPAIVLSGLIFGFAHPVGVSEKLAIAVLGMVFAWMAQTRKSLLPSMTAHFVNNLTTTLLLLAVMGG